MTEKHHGRKTFFATALLAGALGLMTANALGAGLATLPLLKGSGSGLFSPLGEGSSTGRGLLGVGGVGTTGGEFTELDPPIEAIELVAASGGFGGEFALRTSGQSFALFSLERSSTDVESTTTFLPGTTVSVNGRNVTVRSIKVESVDTESISSVGYHFALSDSNFWVAGLEQHMVKRKTTTTEDLSTGLVKEEDTASLSWSRAMVGFSTALDEQLRIGRGLRIGGSLRTAGSVVVKKGDTKAVAGAGRETTVALGWQQPSWSAEVALEQTAENKTAEAQATESVVLSGEVLLWPAEKAHSLALSYTSTKAEKLVNSPTDTDAAYTLSEFELVYTRRLKSLEDAHLELGFGDSTLEYDHPSTATDQVKVLELEGVSISLSKGF